MRFLSGRHGVCAALVLLALAGVFYIFYIGMTKFDINSNFYVEKRILSSSYDLRAYVDGDIIAPDVGGWIVSHDYIYGSYGDSDFFAYKVSAGAVHKFGSVSALNEFLSAEVGAKYDVSAEENVSHLKYGGIRNRKY